MNKKAKKAVSVVVICGLLAFCSWKYFLGSVVSVENIIEDALPLRDAVILLQAPINESAHEKAYIVTTQDTRMADYKMGSVGMVSKNASARIKKLGGKEPHDGELVYSSKNEGGEIYVYSQVAQWKVMLLKNEAISEISIEKKDVKERLLCVQHGKDKAYLHIFAENGQRNVTEIDLQKLEATDIISFAGQENFGRVQKYDVLRKEIIILSDNGREISAINAETQMLKHAKLERKLTNVFPKDGGYIAIENNYMSAIILHYFDENMNKIDEKKIEIPAIASEQQDAGESMVFVALDCELLFSLASEGERAAVCAIDLQEQELLQVSSIKMRSDYIIQDCRFINAAGQAPTE